MTSVWQKALLIIGGTVFALLISFGILTLFPNLAGHPATRSEAGTTVEVEFRYSDGDMFFHQAGRIRPPEEDVVLSRHVLSWDVDGFRLPAMQAAHYPIAAFGDSFTEGTTVALPWPDTLAAELGVPVRNYGYRGYGPLEIAATAEEFAAQDERSWLLYAHFSGNDLMNANRALDQELMQRSPFGQVQWIAHRAGGNLESAPIVTNEDDHYDYPMPVIIGGNFYELVFLEDLLWWQVAPEEGFLDSATFDVVGAALERVAESVAENPCRALIFVPSKEQIYYPYVHEDVRQWLRGVGRQAVRHDNGRIILEDVPLRAEDEADFISHLGDQRDALRQLAEEKDWLFIDLLEPFQQAAAKGQLLYYRYDGHWNQDGHNLAGQVIADFMRRAEGCSLVSD